jgi:membrane protein DedA with SNARE-associated domain
MRDLIVSFLDIFKQLSYFGIVLALSCEIVPAEIVLPLVGFWVYEGDMIFWIAIISGTIGGTIGPLILYFIGRFGGRPFMLKYGKYLLIREKQIKVAEGFFQKYGGGVAFFGRFIPGVRTLIPVPCGIAKMNVGIFTMYTFLAMLPITILYVWLGQQFGPRWVDVGPFARDFLLKNALVLLFVIFLYLGIRQIIRVLRTT